ncbi:chloride transporter [Helicobacter sp. 13S00401-1]|uniref:bifunctional chorismate mutase/prephenate dehydratase n=1 Tax=Helicobacter sp. 13S00401-1 TaxID=1905758 RepID=UPI000BA52D90|nr:bifunctional chorismate mutase/prephenate dehydratase [Helicobacter sp. 13S00401-1]PAF51681.1 chloride transporter [Helicobacter sp. 13S00401-1]
MSKSLEETLSELRDNIDFIDGEILKLINKRLGYVAEVGKAKLANKASIYRPEREREIISKLQALKEKADLKNLSLSSIEAIFYEIFAISRNLEAPQKVAFLGPIGSYTHQAAEDRFGPLSTYYALNNISAVFDALIQKNAKYGVVPLENNINGMVGETIDLLAQSEYKIISELTLPIHHSLASMCESLDSIKRIYSKDIAFGQCSKFLKDYSLSNVEQIYTNSTASAAKLAKEDKNGAAICSKIAAKLYELPIMFENIESNGKNKTRFIIVSDFENKPSSNSKTSAFATIKDFYETGGLLRLMQDFAFEGINLTKIDSRPISANGDFSFGFYIDFHGHRYDENVDRVFKKRKDELKWLGSYPNMDEKA